MSYHRGMADVIPKCSICNDSFLDADDAIILTCKHKMHLSCRDRRLITQGLTCCPACQPSISNRLLYGEFRVDKGNDIKARIEARAIPPQSLFTSGLLVPGQNIAKPTDPAVPEESQTSLLSISKVFMSVVSPTPADSYKSNNLPERVLEALKKKEPVRVLLAKNFRIDDIKSAKVSWILWEDSGYGVADAIALGAQWKDMIDMQFGQRYLPIKDYEVLRNMGVYFGHIFNDIHRCSWAALASMKLSCIVLFKLGFTFSCFYDIGSSEDDILLFNYITFNEFTTYLGLTKDVIVRCQPSLQLIARMRWTSDDFFRQWRMAVDLPQQPTMTTFTRAGHR